MRVKKLTAIVAGAFFGVAGPRQRREHADRLPDR
jgi:hypothetical protein